MIFSSSPYYGLVRRVRRLMGDEENPAAAFSLTAVGTTPVTVSIKYIPPSNNSLALQTLQVSSPNIASQSFDLTQFASIRELLFSLDGMTFGASVLSASYVHNPLRTNDPRDLVPGIFAINAAPRTFFTRHYLSDEDLADDLNGALAQHNQSYVFDPASATPTITGPSGDPTYAYPTPSKYPYPNLASSILYVCPQSEQYLVCLLTAYIGIRTIANRYSRLPQIVTEDATIDRGLVVDRLLQMAAEYKAAYDEGMASSGVGIQVNDLTRISTRIGALSNVPELNNNAVNSVYGLRYLSGSIPNLVQPATTDNAHAYDTTLSQYMFGVDPLQQVGP